MHLKTEKKNLSVWLARVPKYLGEKIMGLRRGSLIGTLGISRPTAGNSVTLQVKLANTLTGIPLEHIIEMRERDNFMYLVNHDTSSENPTSMEVEGVVNKECFIRPVINAEYLEFKRKMKNREEVAEEKTKVVDYFSEVKRSAKYSTLKEMDLLARKRKQMLQGRKRERLEKGDIMEIVFNAFEKHERWTVRDLADFSGQPVAYIQEIVNEVCMLNKQDHKNTYELKPEYKN